MSENESKNTLWYWLAGCAAALLGTLLLCGGLAWFVGTKGVEFLWEKGIEGFTAALREAEFDERDVAGIEHHLGRLHQGWKDDVIGFEELGDFLAAFQEDPFFPVALVRLFEERYLSRAELTVEESAVAAIDLQRFARGLWEGTFDNAFFEEVFGVQTFRIEQENDESMRFDFESEWDSPARLREILADVHTAVEASGIPDEPFRIDLAQEFGRRVDEVLGL